MVYGWFDRVLFIGARMSFNVILSQLMLPFGVFSRGSTAERRHRQRMVLTVFPAACALVMYLVMSQIGAERLADRLQILPEGLIFIELILLSLSSISAILWYLQTGFKKSEGLDSEVSVAVGRQTREHDRAQQMTSRQMEHFEYRLAELSNQVSQLSARDNSNQDFDSETVDIITKSLLEESGERLLNFARGKIENDVRNEIFSDHVQGVFYDGTSRLNSEISALMRRGNLNLVLGAVTTLSGIALLGYFVVTAESNISDAKIFALHYIPKVTLIVFIQIFAFFF